jgi:hypothetical protein
VTSLAHEAKIGHALGIAIMRMNSKDKISKRNALEAKAFVLMAFRDGPIENIHAGATSCSTCGANDSRISDPEMREIMKFAVDRVATLTMLRENNVDQYEKLVVRALDCAALGRSSTGLGLLARCRREPRTMISGTIMVS